MSNTITGNGNIIQYKSDDYVNKVFKYFVLELIKNNDVNNFLTDYEIFNLAINEVNIHKDNIEDQPECIKKLWNDVWKQKNNYLFAYYLSRLYENRLVDNKDHNAKKYYDFSEYIISLNVDFETLDWEDYNKIKKNKDLDNIYGEKMHSITNEFLKNGYVREVTRNENIDDIIELYIENAKVLAYNLKISKITNMTNDLNENKVIDENFTEINEWYYGNEDEELIYNKKRKFEEIIFTIIDKYENNKKQKIENERMEKELNKYGFIEKIMILICRFCLTYCLVVYLTSYVFILKDKENEMIFEKEDIATNDIENITRGLNNFKIIGGTNYEL